MEPSHTAAVRKTVRGHEYHRYSVTSAWDYVRKETMEGTLLQGKFLNGKNSQAASHSVMAKDFLIFQILL